MSALILLLTCVQADPAELVRRLGDESIEARERAAADLLKLGESARAAIVKGTASSDPETRARSTAILEYLDLQRDLRAWLEEPPRISITGERTLKEAMEAFEKQSGVKVSADAWPDERFALDVRDVPMWEALDAICKASGKRTLSLTPEGPRLIGSRWKDVPMVISRNCAIRFDSIKTSKTRLLESGSDTAFFNLVIAAGWSKPVFPIRTRLSLTVVEDDLGQSLLEGFHEIDRHASMGTPIVPSSQAPVHATMFSKATRHLPLPTSTLLRRVEGTLAVWIRAAPGDVEIPLPGPAAAPVEIVGPDLATVLSAEALLLSSIRNGPTMTCSIELPGLEEWMVKGALNPWMLKDKEGRTYEGFIRRRRITMGPRQKLELGIEFRDLPDSAEPVSFSLRVPRKVVAIEIPFVLKDVPLK